MLTITTGTSSQLQSQIDGELAAYRHKVFVEHLGWDLPVTERGLERDQFDRPDTLYVVAQDERGHVCGCARLLPTTQDYLLGSVFPHLLGGQTPACSPEIWELSRYSTQAVSAEVPSREAARERFRLLLKAVVHAAAEMGAARLITFSFLGVERLARGFGLHIHRAGAPQTVDGKTVVAFWIELDQQTFDALEPLNTAQPSTAAGATAA